MCEAVPPQSLLPVRFSAQCVVESCDSHLHHSLQLMSPHQVVTFVGLVGGKEMKRIMHALSVQYNTYTQVVAT